MTTRYNHVTRILLISLFLPFFPLLQSFLICSLKFCSLPRHGGRSEVRRMCRPNGAYAAVWHAHSLYRGKIIFLFRQACFHCKKSLTKWKRSNTEFPFGIFDHFSIKNIYIRANFYLEAHSWCHWLNTVNHGSKCRKDLQCYMQHHVIVVEYELPLPYKIREGARE